ncbi:MAG: OmpH family outer membrane protein [Prevotella sp.]|uniref:OmpH family outer membrane protein n=1 Tax=Prevotella sp. TaxID=59823 RepID=UPI00258AA7B1|nr:OmpH family outer membrane protein [Prevotella sp.]MDD6854535.1 OmpH family outer membrane protein [Prevotella sp.]
MKKILLTLSVAAMLGMGMTSCNNQPQKNDTQDSSTKGSIADSQADMKIAYVEVDSIMSQYQYWKDVMKLMQGKEANIQKTLQGKQQSLQQAAASFQQGIQSNKFSRDEAQQIQANLQMQAQEGDQLQQRLSNEYQKEVSKYNQALSDSIHHFLAEYNKDKKFTLILAKQGDNILYANNALDITDQVVAGLNKRYKGMGNKK